MFIINRNFIFDLLSVFGMDMQIGMLGMVGNRLPWKDTTALARWDTGKAVDSGAVYPFCLPSKEDGFLEVRMADGFLLATQYDLLWREDVFDYWHFYDFAQCMEFKKAGYKVAVPWQEQAWCYHDNSYPDLRRHCEYYELFVREYGEREDFPVEKKDMTLAVYEENRKALQIRNDLKEIVEKYFRTGDRVKLRKVLGDPLLGDLPCMWEYELIVRIDCQEEEHQSLLRFWGPEMQLPQLLSRLRALKHALKRIEYGADTGGERNWIAANYSYHAVSAVGGRYFK